VNECFFVLTGFCISRSPEGQGLFAIRKQRRWKQRRETVSNKQLSEAEERGTSMTSPAIEPTLVLVLQKVWLCHKALICVKLCWNMHVNNNNNNNNNNYDNLCGAVTRQCESYRYKGGYSVLYCIPTYLECL